MFGIRTAGSQSGCDAAASCRPVSQQARHIMALGLIAKVNKNLRFGQAAICTIWRCVVLKAATGQKRRMHVAVEKR
jgi:hypothetical protein